MARFSSDHVPAYRLHKRSGQAVVTIGSRDHYLGQHDSSDSRQKYNTLIAQWFSVGRDTAAFEVKRSTPATTGPTVEEVIAHFWIHAQQYYRDREGQPSGELQNFHDVLRILRRMYGTTPAVEFGPRSLKALRDEMIRLGWSRKSINRRTGRIKFVFKWAVSEEMLPPAVFEGLNTVTGLRKGRSDAVETTPITPGAERAEVTKGLPRVVYTLIDDPTRYSDDGAGSLRKARYQIDAFARVYDEARGIVLQISAPANAEQNPGLDGYSDTIANTLIQRIYMDSTRVSSGEASPGANQAVARASVDVLIDYRELLAQPNFT